MSIDKIKNIMEKKVEIYSKLKKDCEKKKDTKKDNEKLWNSEWRKV